MLWLSIIGSHNFYQEREPLMSRLYLITGFLGAGKTTFLMNFISNFKNQKIAFVINEFGKIGVDGSILKELKVAMEEIDNGSIFCACRIGQFEDALYRLGNEEKPDVIIVEASGLSDPTTVGNIIKQDKFCNISYEGAICLVDAKRFPKVVETAKVCKMQLAIADWCVINKMDLVSEEELQHVEHLIKSFRPDIPIITTSFGKVCGNWFMDRRMKNPSVGEIHTKDITLKKLELYPQDFSVEELQNFLHLIAEQTYRIKGFVQIEGKIYLINCVGPMVEITNWNQPVTSDLFGIQVLYGNGLQAKKAIREAMKWYPNKQIERKQEG